MRLSADYRAGAGALDFESKAGRAAYLWHHLPAHVCDLARLFLDVPGILDDEERATLTLVGLGAGPGTEVLALVEALTRVREQGGLPELARVSVTRVDHHAAWDSSFTALIAAATPLWQQRDPGLGDTWTLEAPAASIAVDLASGALPAKALEAVAKADLVVAANLLTEVAPRGTDELPPGFAASLDALLDAAPQGALWLLVDRRGAPGAQARLEAAALRAEARGWAIDGPRDRDSRCACPLTRAAKAVYEHVKLPTTRHEDRPVANCQTTWWRLLKGGSFGEE